MLKAWMFLNVKVNKRDVTMAETDIVLYFEGVVISSNKIKSSNYLSTIFIRESSTLRSQYV